MNTLAAAHADLWREATGHPFLDGIRNGGLPAVALDTWLAQDYQFVERLLRAQALTLAQAPRSDQSVLTRGLAALAEELHWFETLACDRSLNLDVLPQPDCQEYSEYLLTLAWSGLAGDQPYAACITALWTVERAYLDAWQSVRPGAAAFRALVEHWTMPDFASYVAELAAAANRALATSSVPVQDAAVDTFARVARFERDFWQMAFAAR